LQPLFFVTKPINLDTNSYFFTDLYYFINVNFNSLAIIPIFTVFLLLLILFYLSGAEVALFSLSYKDLNYFKTQKDDASKRIVHFFENPKGLLGSLTIASIVLTIAIIILSNYIIDNFFDKSILWVWPFLTKVVVIALFIVFFGNILPKVWASHNKVRFAKNSSFIVEIVFLLFSSISKPLIQVSDKFDNTFGADKRKQVEGELLDFTIDKLPDEEASLEEKKILKEIRKFGNTTVKQIMRPRLDVNGIAIDTQFDELVKKIEDLHYSRLPVFESTLDDIKGMLYIKDVLPNIEQPANFNWQPLIRTAVFVHEQKLIEDLLQEFRTKQVHIAIVVDEFGGTSGIVTLEDILEEVIGEISDEFDEEDLPESKINENVFLFDGKTMINDVCKKMNIDTNTFNEIKGESDSLGGLVLEIAEEIPKQGQTIISGDFHFTVEEIEKNRIKKVKIEIKQ
jgi:putative hemolysin